ncbi:TRAP transporter small permease [Thermodesulforhabdus norvegica]|nr:TRAP transporter small permease [Thermodesulforhabdus norvegica]
MTGFIILASLFFEKLSRVLVSIMVGAMLVVVLSQVVFRYLLQSPLPWSEELARYLMIWAACLAGANAYADKAHVTVNIITRSIAGRMERFVNVGIHAVVATLMLVIFYQGWKLALKVSDQLSPAMSISMFWTYSSVPVGAGMTFTHALRLLLQTLFSPDTRDTVLME